MKSKSSHNNQTIDEIKRHYNNHQDQIRQRLLEFRSVPASEYFYELAYCLLTPQSSAAHAEQAIIKLREKNFQNHEMDAESILASKDHYIRFHKTKARYLQQLKLQIFEIVQKVTERSTAYEKREWLVMSVNGLGYKEATHFLRNIGKNDGLAILDRHILRTLKQVRIIRTLPKSMSKKQYLLIENKFIKFAMDIGIVLDELDLVLWSMGTGEIRK